MKGAVVVVTGASSGIGRATALEMARRGANVALLARRHEPLSELARECERHGIRAIALTADVTDEPTVKAAARHVVDTLGRIDVWINNAGVLALGQFVDMPPAAFRRVIDVNFMGTVHGAQAVLPHFLERGRGVLINVASVDSLLAFPYFTAYVASKHAVRGFTRCLRQELEHLGHTGIRVCEVMPATIDTPLFQHAANYTGRRTRAMPPVYPPERVARTIAHLAERPSPRDRFVGGAGRVMRATMALFPRLGEAMMARMIDREHLDGRPQEPTAGNLFEPVAMGTEATGGWLAPEQGRGRKRLARAAMAAAAMALPVAVGVAALRSP